MCWSRSKVFQHCSLECLNKTLCQSIYGWVVRCASDVFNAIPLHKFCKFLQCKLRAIIQNNLFWEAIGCKHFSHNLNRLFSSCTLHFDNFRPLIVCVHQHEVHFPFSAWSGEIDVDSSNVSLAIPRGTVVLEVGCSSQIDMLYSS